MSKRTRRGMTIIELLFVVAIIGILAVVALPAFQLYRFRTRTAESMYVMNGIRLNQSAFSATFDNYANITTPNPDPAGPAGPAGVTKRRWDNVACPATCTRDAPVNCTAFGCIGFQPSGDVYYHYVSPSVAVGFGGGFDEYAIGSTGDVDSDGIMGGYGYQSANAGGGIGFVGDGISGCPVGLPADSIHNCTPSIY
jgi:prepilin-type N-terminal cleavage/methylation domain-containing protein